VDHTNTTQLIQPSGSISLAGCRLFLQMPPGHVLRELGQEAFADVRTLAVGETSLTYAARIVPFQGTCHQKTVLPKICQKFE
jgi:hypothetical protein